MEAGGLSFSVSDTEGVDIMLYLGVDTSLYLDSCQREWDPI